MAIATRSCRPRSGAAASSSAAETRPRRARTFTPNPPAAQTGARGAEQLGLRIGDDVRHEKFGEGVILDIIGAGDKAEAVVRFPDAGEKRLLLQWAPLTRV